MTWDPTRFVSFDTETHLIQPGLAAPPLVCASAAAPDARDEWLAGGVLLDKDDARTLFGELLRDDAIMVLANAPFDFIVMATDAARRGIDLFPAIFAKYERGEVFDILVAEKLHAIAEGTLGTDPRNGGPLRSPSSGKVSNGYYSLDIVADIVLGRTTAKVNDAWRERYAELDGVPIEDWPADARTYPVDDAVNTLDVAVAQVARNRNLHDLAAQVYTDFVMALGAAWGFSVDPAKVAALKAASAAAREAGVGEFQAAGIYRADGTQDMGLTKGKIAAAFGAKGVCATCAGSRKTPTGKGGNLVQCKGCDATGLDLSTASVPRAEKGGVSTSRDTLTESGDEMLMRFGAFGADKKILTTYVPWLEQGIRDGRSIPLNLRPNVLVASGRTSYGGSGDDSDDGTDVSQLLPRKGGVRDCIVARAGFVLVSTDYDSGELITHAQNCLWTPGVGYSRLAEALVKGVKVHNLFAARLAGGITYDDYNARLKADPKKWGDYRQGSKAANFGFPGGMGAPKLVLQKRKDPDLSTVAPDGTKYNGLRFCVILGGEARCGLDMVTVWGQTANGSPRDIAPTCRRCIEVAVGLRNAWFEQWPENREYFQAVKRIVDATGEIVQHVSKRVRGGVWFTNAANGYFQSLLADAAKAAMRRVQRECCDRSLRSPLLGSRVILLAHDELLSEIKADRLHDAAWRQSKIMEEELIRYCPDLAPAVHAEPAAMSYWAKGALRREDSAGRLIVWE